MDLVVPFDHPQGSTLGLVGGKGNNLIALRSGGFPVPPGFVVTAEAYRLFVQGVGWLDEELTRFDYASPDRLREQCARLRARLSELALPEAVQAAIRAALAHLGGSEEDPFAVRSSSTLEDLAQAAFAGQHDTYLNIRGTEAIVERVRDCFVSLWGDRAVLYRHHQGFPQQQARMAVVVQRQILCDRAGVGFSINPVSGQLQRLILDANYGLGESVVSGEGEVDHFELDKESLQVEHRTIGHKDRMVVPTPAGVAEQPVPADLADRPCLAEEEIRAVGELLRRVEAHYGWPQDIEWGWKEGRLYLFQSRPVTTIQARHTRDESAERFPNPMTPLCWEFFAEVFRDSLAHSLALMGLPPLKEDWFSLHGHYIYGNQNAVELLASYRPLKARNMQQLLAEIPQLRQRYAWVLELPVRWARDLDRYLIRLGRLSAASLEGMDVGRLWQHVLAVQAVAAEYFLPNIAISITQSFLHRVLYQLAGMSVGPERALSALDGLLAGCETKTAVVNRELHELAQLAAKTPRLQQELLDRGGRDFWDQDRTHDFPEFAARFGRFLEDHGHRELDMDYYHPTWSGQPWVVLDSVRLILRRPAAEDPAATARQLRVQYAETEHEFLSIVPEGLRFFFRELIRLARTYTTLDDLEHYQTTRTNPVARQAAIALGQKLVEHGILDAPEDVFFFHRADLEELVRAFPKVQPEGYREKVYETKRSYETARAATPLWSLDEAAASVAAPAGGALRGLPGSPGKTSGPCFRVNDPSDFGRFPAKAILVARTTNPAWTPLFYSAAGLVTESGGPLSHGAVTAREMRLPAVMSVRQAMSLLCDEQVVTVDGTQGIVWTGSP
jgi:phosphohistidine swiveling domain-containing protein